MSKSKFMASVALVGVVTAGCIDGGKARVEPSNVASYYRENECEVDRPGDPAPFRNSESRRRPGAIDLSCFRFPDQRRVELRQVRTRDSQAQAAPAEAGNDTAERSLGATAYEAAVKTEIDRDRLVYALIGQADNICTIEKSLMMEWQAAVNGYLSIATTGLSTASTIVTGELASNILSGGAALTSGSRDHVNTHVYRNQIIQTITSAIDSERSTTLSDIQQRLVQKVEQYSIDEAIRDVNAYHQLCSFGTGLQVVMQAVEAKEENDKSLRLNAIDEQIEYLSGRAENLVDSAKLAVEADIRALERERIRLVTGISLGDSNSGGEAD